LFYASPGERFDKGSPCVFTAQGLFVLSLYRCGRCFAKKKQKSITFVADFQNDKV
jgi:hypothetical protein